MVLIPKHRRKVLYGTLRRHLGEIFRRLARFVGHHFGARGYFVSTVGRDEQVIRRYIQNQENEDRQQDQLTFG